MGEFVNQINLSDITVAIVDDKTYRITLYWTLNGGMPCSYKGTYFLILYENAIEKERQSFADTQGQHYIFADFSVTDISELHHIQLAVPEEQGGVASDKAKLILDRCTEVRGTSEQGTFDIFWKTQTFGAPYLLCTFSTSRGVCNQYYINPRAGYFRLVNAEYTPGDTIDITLKLTDKNKVSGPASPLLHFYTEAPVLLEADLTREAGLAEEPSSAKEDRTRLSLLFRSAYEDLTGGKLCLASDGVSVTAYTIDSFSKKEDGIWEAKTVIPYASLSFEALTQCTVSLNLSSGQGREAESRFSSPQNCLALEVPSLEIESVNHSEIRFLASAGRVTPPPAGYELSDGRLISGSRFSLPYDRKLSLRVRARYNREELAGKGPWSNTVTSFSPGFYLEKTDNGSVLKFYHAAFDEPSVTYTFTEELFLTPPSAPVESGSIRLAPTGSGGYTMSISCESPVSRTEYADFLSKVSDRNTAQITPYGFYRLCDAFLRLAPHLITDTAYLLCALEQEYHTADLRPGMVLNLSTALYQPQYDPQVSNTAGFSAMHSQSIPLSLSSDAAFLDFDRYVGIMAECMSASTLPGEPSKIIYASGVADLAAPAARQPYYRMLYPSSLVREYNMESPYPSDNIVLLAADSYSSILSACETLKKNPAAINNLPVPLIIFKGRSTLSLHIPVLFNGQKTTVPAGSTLQNILQQNGIFAPDNASLFRRSADGREMPVYLNLAEELPEITLISGDRIEAG